jgi:delta 1-pyrroline-5-carboxylate dehydrogenase
MDIYRVQDRGQKAALAANTLIHAVHGPMELESVWQLLAILVGRLLEIGAWSNTNFVKINMDSSKEAFIPRL